MVPTNSTNPQLESVCAETSGPKFGKCLLLLVKLDAVNMQVIKSNIELEVMSL